MRTRLTAGLALATLLLTGCAASRLEVRAPASAAGSAAPTMVTSEAPEGDERTLALEQFQELIRLDVDPDALSELDCATACELARRVCALDARICAIAERHPGDPELEAGCGDAHDRCQRARRRVRERCGCAP